jgi:hypothetical protein
MLSYIVCQSFDVQFTYRLAFRRLPTVAKSLVFCVALSKVSWKDREMKPTYRDASNQSASERLISGAT